jgi:crotonobetainyl-CoA:carnitine CoA-transferase CaiB-like acyl-CoA transferase
VGDSSRRHGPFRDDVADAEQSGLFLFLNTNKRGVTLDAGSAGGRGLLGELCDWADVVIHNLAPAVLDGLGGYEGLAEGHETLNLVSITVFGYDTPYRDWKGSALTATAASGISDRIGDPGRSPLWIPYCAADFQGGIHGAIAALMAQRARRATGEGQHAWLAITEVMGTYLGGYAVPAYIFTGRRISRSGRHMAAFYPWQVAEAADGYFEVITMVDDQWKRFTDLMGNPPWAEDERLKNRWLAHQWAEELDANWHPWMKERTKAELWQHFRERHIAFQPIQTIAEVVESEQLEVRGFWQEVEHPAAGRIRLPGAPYRLSETPWAIRRPPPLLGQHNAEVYGELLGHGDGELAGLREAGVI